MMPSTRLPRKCEIPAEVNRVHPTTIRVPKYKEVTTAGVMHVMVDGINFIICLGHKPDKISLSVFCFLNKYIQVIQHLNTLVTLKNAHTYLQIEKTLILIQSIVKCVPSIKSQNILGATEDQKEHFLPPGLTPTAGRRACQGAQLS